MLTDTKLRNLKPEAKPYKLSDRDGLYVMVLTTGTVSFRYNYRINGRQETLVLGCYGPGGLTLAEAREKLAEAKKGLSAGKSPARHKAREKQKISSSDPFGEWTDHWLKNYQMADSTRDMRRSVFERDLKEPFGHLKMGELTHEDLRTYVTRSWSAERLPRLFMHAKWCIWFIDMRLNADTSTRIRLNWCAHHQLRVSSQRIGH